MVRGFIGVARVREKLGGEGRVGRRGAFDALTDKEERVSRGVDENFARAKIRGGSF